MLQTLNRSRALKRVIDLLAAVGLLLCLWPIMLLVAGLIRWKMGSPVVFTQTRPGKDGKPIQFYKFRTMRNANGPDGKPLPDARRMTPLGTLIRKTSMDELPQLWNVLKGEVSLVGPRPLLMEYLPHYTAEENRRHSVPPGITGWAQINGRNAISWDERLRLDVEYVNNWSNALDFKILFLTIHRVITAGHQRSRTCHHDPAG
jgi:lipopolysaccharide/colanic/teichoic acid biosynthesis glycosyltransferase